MFSGAFVLCVHDNDANKGNCVKHYKIRKMDNGGCYITPKAIFASQVDLVRHYQGELWAEGVLR